MEALVGAFNQVKALVGAFTVIVKPSRRFVASSMYTTDTGEERTGRGIKHNSLGRAPCRGQVRLNVPAVQQEVVLLCPHSSELQTRLSTKYF